MARPLVVNSQLQIPACELTLTFARSSGPGGQNVNKVSSKAVLRWNVKQATILSDDAKSRFQQRYASRINNVGEVVLSSDRHRDQPKNISDCYDKLRQLVLSVLVTPRVRKKTKPSRGAVQRRLEKKRLTSKRKQQRRYRPGRDD